jgi:hypothetical protein
MERFSKRLAASVARKINPSGGSPTLRMSNLGKPCSRQLWYSINKAGAASKPDVSRAVKFLYGDMLEELLLFLAEEAGHSVTGCQDQLTINGVVGHRDAVIDGVVVDVKSASTYSFKKFKEGLSQADDAFGYRTQLQSYLYASRGDPLVTDLSRCAFLVIDKTLGHICLDIHKAADTDYNEVVEAKRAVVNAPIPPDRHFTDEPMGASGNRKLKMECGYCDWNKSCWPNLRTFVYAHGPVFLTHVEETPRVLEVERPF